MKKRPIIFASFCLLASYVTATNAPTRDYTMINYDTGLTTTMLEVGTTSFTFVVEWASDRDTPCTLALIGRPYPSTRGWNFVCELELDKTGSPLLQYGVYSRFPVKLDRTQRKATFEILNRVLSDEYYVFEQGFEGKAFFSVQWPVEPEDWESTYGSEEHEIFGPNVYELGLVKSNEAEQTITNYELEIKNDEQGRGEPMCSPNGQTHRPAPTEGRRGSWWLYLGICAVCYLAWRRFSRN